MHYLFQFKLNILNWAAQPANSQNAADKMRFISLYVIRIMHIIFIFLSISPFCIPVFRSVISPAAPTYSRDESALRLFALCLCHRTTKHCFMRFKSLSFSLYAFLQFVNINRGVFLSPRHRMIFRRSVADLSPSCL